MNVWKPILAALVIFAAGVITGGMVVRMQPGPWARPSSGGPEPGSLRPVRAERLESPTALRNWAQPPGEGQLRDLSQRMGRYLELTPEQRERVQTLLKESQARMREIADEMAPKTREEFRRLREGLRQELRPDQRQRFEEMFKAREGRLRRTNAPPEQAGEPRF